jgi:hypothetical protein
MTHTWTSLWTFPLNLGSLSRWTSTFKSMSFIYQPRLCGWNGSPAQSRRRSTISLKLSQACCQVDIAFLNTGEAGEPSKRSFSVHARMDGRPSLGARIYCLYRGRGKPLRPYKMWTPCIPVVNWTPMPSNRKLGPAPDAPPPVSSSRKSHASHITSTHRPACVPQLACCLKSSPPTRT